MPIAVFARCLFLPSGPPSLLPLVLLLVEVAKMTAVWESTLKMISDSDESFRSSPASTPFAPKASLLLLCALLLAQRRLSSFWFSSSSWSVLELMKLVILNWCY